MTTISKAAHADNVAVIIMRAYVWLAKMGACRCVR